MSILDGKEKRTWAYLQSPSVYCVSACSCGNNDTQWSEYAKHLWCAKCEIDFMPESNGVFDGPIPLNTAIMMGMTFDRLNLKTNRVEILDTDADYITCLNFSDTLNEKLIPVNIKNDNKNLIANGFLDCKTFKIKNIILNEANELENKMTTELIFDYPDKNKILLTWLNQNGDIKIQEDKESDNFKTYLLNNYLDYSLKEKHTKNSVKI